MIWRRHLDLPSELEGKLPRLATEAIVALAGVGLAVGLRVGLQQIAPDIVPFALAFPAIAMVTLLAGGRAGLMAVTGCQLLIWYAILPPPNSFAIESVTVALNLILVTMAQLVMLAVIAGYRRAIVALHADDRRQIDSLSLALHEIDHRTKNNFQLAIGLLSIQARNTDDHTVQTGLNRAAARLQAIASVYRNLALSSSDLEDVRLHEHLGEICARLRDGLLSPAITLKLDVEPVAVPHELAIRIGLIVNELVTNAAKHAFPQGIGTVRVAMMLKPDHIDLEISDDGQGIAPDAPTDGLGTKLVAMLARQIDAETTMTTDQGVRHRFVIPLAQN